MKPTGEAYDNLEKAYSHFNVVLFGGRLPTCLITMQRRKGTYGYFWGDTWTDREGDHITDEIALNPDAFQDRRDDEVFSTLVHEMCHLQQHHFGKPSRSAYHNKEWAQMMEAVGLIPSNTGQEGGKKTGQKMTHYIEEGGAFRQACTALFESGVSITWQALTRDEAKAAKKRASKTKYTCPGCGVNAWAKPETKLICGECEQALEPED